MPYIITATQLKEIIDEKCSEIVLNEVPVDKLEECVGFTYRWLKDQQVTVTVTYKPSDPNVKSQTVKTGINADLKFLKKCLERNPSEYYWMDCISVPQDDNSPAKKAEIFNMRTYYSKFKRVAFIGNLEGTTHDGHYELKQVSKLYYNVLNSYTFSPSGKTLLNTLFNNTGRQILNEYETRAWTFQEIAVAKEIEFMGLIGTVHDFGELTFCIPHDSGYWDVFASIFLIARNVKIPLNLSTAFKRTALHARDIFYALLPVYDSSLSGKDHLVAWDSIREEFGNSLFSKATETTLWIDPRWYGINNVQILHAFAHIDAKPLKMRACHKNDKLYVNWTIGKLKLHVTVNLLELKKCVKLEENIWYFSFGSVFLSSNLPTVQKGNLEETNEWKEHLFVWKTENELAVRIISAKDLYGADSGGTSDPYVKLPRYYNTSKVIKKTVNPFWNETFIIPVPESGKDDELTLEVWDENRIQKDELIGTATITLKGLENFKEKITEVSLKGLKAKGTVRVGLTLKMYNE